MAQRKRNSGDFEDKRLHRFRSKLQSFSNRRSLPIFNLLSPKGLSVDTLNTDEEHVSELYTELSMMKKRRLCSPSPQKRELLSTVAAQSCLDMGFSKAIVKQSIRHFIEEHGHTSFKGHDLAMDLEENIDHKGGDGLRDMKCQLCKDSAACVTFLPCGHSVTCASCSQILRKCPVCKEAIKDRLTYC